MNGIIVSRKFTVVIWLLVVTLATGCAGRPVVMQGVVPVKEVTVQEGTLSDKRADEDIIPVEADTSAGADGKEDNVAGADYMPTITVHVCGAVVKPGVYRLPKGAIVLDAVLAAGGFASEADSTWCNQARKLTDSEQLRIYTTEETSQLAAAGQKSEAEQEKEAGTAGSSTSDAADAVVNLNTASKEQLMMLPGIGETRADDILAYRRKHGSFTSVEQLKEISGIGDAIFSRLRDRIII